MWLVFPSPGLGTACRLQLTKVMLSGCFVSGCFAGNCGGNLASEDKVTMAMPALPY